MKWNLKGRAVTGMSALLLGSLTLSIPASRAQTAPQKIALVNVAEILKVNPGNPAVVALAQQRDTELGSLDAQIKALRAQGPDIKPADKDKLNQLIATIQAKIKDYDQRLSALAAPITEQANNAVATAAKANGVAVVLDAAAAGSSGTVIYVDPSTDLTDAVRAQMQKK